LATSGWMMYGWMVVWSLSGLAGPALQGIMSRQVSESEQGELQGALASIGSLTSIVAPLMLTNLFWFFTSPLAPTYLPGAPFLAASLFCTGALGIFMAAQRRARMRIAPEVA